MDIKVKQEFGIFIETDLLLPDSLVNDFQEICKVASIQPDKVKLTIKNRNKLYGRWRHAPSGTYYGKDSSIVVRVVPNMRTGDFNYVLAHEVGHLKQSIELQQKSLRGVIDKEVYATNFAINSCNCYPNKETNYRGVGEYIKTKERCKI